MGLLRREEKAALIPAPVEHYLRRAIGRAPGAITVATIRQRGELRFDGKGKWTPFEAEEIVRPEEVAFEWNARVPAGKFFHVRVREAYRDSRAEARVRLNSLITIAHDRGGEALNRASLFRFLAEAPWYPTALTPSARLGWEAIDDTRASAVLVHAGSTTRLEFRFDTFGDVSAIYAAARPRRRRGGFDIAPWEGHFRDYRQQDGMRIPMYGEVGWYEADRWDAVWKGTILDARYEFSSGKAAHGSGE